MSDLLSQIAENTVQVLSVQNDVNKINFVNGLTDPGEMIRCGYMPEIRRQAGEQDAAYAERIRPIVMAMPQAERDLILNAAVKRAGYDLSNGKVNVMVAGDPPWAGLGTHVDKAATAAVTRHLAGLEWNVIKKMLSYRGVDGVSRIFEDQFVLIRSDTNATLSKGSVGSVYKPIQNSDMFDCLDGALAEHGAYYESAGSLWGGSKVWMLARLPKQDFRVNGDEMENYIIFQGDHSGLGADFAFPTVKRVVCGNTFTQAISERKKGIALRHTGDIKVKIQEASKVLATAINSMERFKNDAETMYSKKMAIRPFANKVLDKVLEVTEKDCKTGAELLAKAITNTQEQMAEIVKVLEKKIEKRKNSLEEIVNRWEEANNGVNGMRGTVWSNFNAFTEWANHGKIGKESKDEQTRLSRRFESVIAGERDEIMQAAYGVAMSAK